MHHEFIAIFFPARRRGVGRGTGTIRACPFDEPAVRVKDGLSLRRFMLESNRQEAEWLTKLEQVLLTPAGRTTPCPLHYVMIDFPVMVLPVENPGPRENSSVPLYEQPHMFA